MFALVRSVFAPLLSLFIFILGSGLFTTLLTVRLHQDHASVLYIGAISAMYYAGLGCGSFRIEPFIVRIGHIRSFAAFASILAVVSLLQGMWFHAVYWLVLRFVGGFATAGLFIVIESWLLVKSSVKTRGQILAIYMIVLYAAQALGQFFINLHSSQMLFLFAITAMLASLSVIPLAMTTVSSPEYEAPSTLNFKKLYKVSGSGVIGCLCSGLILSAIYGLLPLYVSNQASETSMVALVMAVTILGGTALQYPIGRFSDVFERRLVLVFTSILTAIFALLIMQDIQMFHLNLVFCFLFGGMTFALYPVSISHACDSLESSDILAATQGLLLAYSIGATLGPIICPLFITLLGNHGLIIYFIFIAVFMALFFSWRKTRHTSVEQEDAFVTMPQTTPILAELDPRIDSESAKQ